MKIIQFIIEPVLCMIKAMSYFVIAAFTFLQLKTNGIPEATDAILKLINENNNILLKAIIYVSILESIHNLIGYLKIQFGKKEN